MINNSQSGDSIFLKNKTYIGNGKPIDIQKNITICGYSHSSTILNAKNISSIFNISPGANVKLINLTLINCHNGVIRNFGNLSIISSDFLNNDGSSIVCDNGNVKLLNCTFMNSNSNDGVIYNKFGNVYCDNLNFFNNTGVKCSVISNYRGTVKVNNSRFKNNCAFLFGTVYNEGFLLIYDDKFEFNKAQLGGAIYNLNKTLINNSVFNFNKAFDAGAIYSSSDLIIDNSQFQYHEVSHNGGVIYIQMGNLYLNNSLFRLNSGADEGGSILVHDGNVLINNSKFISNNAKSYGAAIDNNGRVTVYNSCFNNNHAWGAGAIDNGGTMFIANSNFTNNNVNKNGGAIDNNGNMSIYACIFENNHAGGDGGAIIARKNTSVSNSIIYNNFDVNGYAVFNRTRGNISFLNNWWGVNNPNFNKLMNFNVCDNFTWITIDFKNITPLIQNKHSLLSVNLQIINKLGDIFSLNSSNHMPVFNLELSVDNYKYTFENNSFNKSFMIPECDRIKATINNQTLYLNVLPIEYHIVLNNKKVVDYGENFVFKVTVVDNFGDMSENVDVILKIGKKIFNLKSDKNGNIFKKVKLTPGKYTVHIYYGDYEDKTVLLIKHVLKAKNVFKKKSTKIKYRAFLKTSSGKALYSKKVIFKINHKIYSVKTNKKGIATVLFKNLKIGKHKIVVKYLNSQIVKFIKIFN